MLKGHNKACVEEVPCCVNCGSTKGLMQCNRCKTVLYCSITCQRNHYEQHQIVCKTIYNVEHPVRVHKLDEIKGQVLGINAKSRKNLVKLVGEKCTLNCSLGGKEVSLLWDTGAQVSIFF